MNRTNAGGANFHADDGAIVFGDQFGDGAFVFPEVSEILAKGERGNGEKRAIDRARFTRGAGAREVKAVVVNGAEPREQKRAILVLFGEFSRAEETRDVEGLSFDKHGGDFTRFGEAEVAAVGGEDDGGVCNRARAGFQFPVEKIVKRNELVCLFFEIGGI